MNANVNLFLNGGGKLVRNNLLATTFLSLALGAASCTNETEQLVDSRTAPMSIQVSNHIASRGLISSATLPVDAYGIGVTLVNKSDKQKYDGQDGYSNMQWTTTNGSTWNIASGTNPNLTGTEGVAVAYYPYSSSATDYTAIPVESATQTDYMYSGWSNDLNNATPQAEFTMNHALAAVRVKLAVSANYTGDKSASAVTIASDGFMASASLNAETGALANKTGAGAVHSQDGLALTLDATGKDVDFMVIPADAPSEITFLATIGGKQYSASVTPGEALAQGLIHTYTLTLSAAGMTTSSVSVSEWGNGQTGSGNLKPVGPSVIKVYAVSSSGELIDYTTADATCKGVAIHATGKNFDKKFMIAKNDASNDGSNYMLYWGNKLYGKDVAGITNILSGGGYIGEGKTYGTDFTTWSTGPVIDFGGNANTQAIIAAYSQYSEAMDAKDMCKVLETFNDGSDNQGHNDWFVPACGQLALMYLAKTEINAALVKIGGTAFNESDAYKSSSECYADNYWYMGFGNGIVDRGDKNRICRVRFIRDIK